MAAELTVLQAGSVFRGRYEVTRCIRRGGMGAVYEVRDAHTTRRRALKVMLPTSVSDPDLRARFAQETTITAEVRSDHTVEIFDAGIDDATGSPFLVMELLEGDDLSSVLERGPLDGPEVCRILGQLARALDKTHAAGIVHRDLKPENLFLARTDDPGPRLKILDFGVAKLVAPEGTAKTTRVLGTPLYMSKEQILGDGSVGPAADLYAMAHIAYAMLTARPYWQDEASSSPAPFVFMSKVLAGAPEPASERARRHGVELPAGFDDWFARATDLDPMLRFQKASELLRELEPILRSAPLSAERASRSAGPEVSARPSTTDPNAFGRPPPVERRSPTVALAALLAAGSIVTIGLVSRGGVPTERAPTQIAPGAHEDLAAPAPPAPSGEPASTSAPVAAIEPTSVPSASPDAARSQGRPRAGTASAPKPTKADAKPTHPGGAPSSASSAPKSPPPDEPDPTKVR